MGMNRLTTSKVVGISQGFKKEREGVIVGKNGVFDHVGVNGNWGMEDFGMGEGSD